MSGKPRIAYVVGELETGGTERQLLLLLTSLPRSEISPIVIVWNLNTSQSLYPHFKALGVEIRGVDRARGRLGRLIGFLRLIREIRPDYIHSYSFHTNFPVWLASLFIGGKKTLGSFRSDYTHERKNTGMILGRLCAFFPRDSISNNQAAIEKMKQSIFSPAKIWHVPNAVNLESYHVKNSPSTREEVWVVSTGRLSPMKRWPWLIDILSEADVAFERWQFHLYGIGKCRDEILSRIGTRGLRAKVFLKGLQAQPETWLSEYDIFLFTSEYEGMPNAVLEAMAAGLPVLSTRAGDVDKMIEDGVNGFVVEPTDREGFRKKLLLLLSSKELREHLGKNARRTIAERFTHRNLLKNTFQVYSEMDWRKCERVSV